MKRHALPAFAALALVAAGPQAERFEAIHAPRVVLMLALAAALFWRGRARLRDVEWLALASLGAMAVSAAFATSPAYALTPLALAGVSCAVLLCTRADERELWLEWLAGAVLLVAALGLAEVLGLGPASLPGRAPSATMGQRNALAHFLLLGAPVVWAALPRRVLVLAGTFVIAAVIVATRSRAAWLTALPVLACFAAFHGRAALRPAVAAAAGIAAAALAPVALRWKSAHPYLDSLRRLVDFETGSGAGRLVEWKASLALFAEHPLLGVGPGNWFVEYGVAHGGGRFAHSDLVGFLVERGALGAVLLAALAFAVVRRGVDRKLVVPVFVAALGVGAFDSVLQLPAPLLLVSCVAFVGAAPEGPPRPARPMAVVFAVVALAALSATASLIISSARSTPLDRLELAARLNPLDGELRATLAEAWTSAGDCERARPHVHALTRLLPRHPKLPALGVCAAVAPTR